MIVVKAIAAIFAGGVSAIVLGLLALGAFWFVVMVALVAMVTSSHDPAPAQHSSTAPAAHVVKARPA